MVLGDPVALHIALRSLVTPPHSGGVFVVAWSVEKGAVAAAPQGKGDAPTTSALDSLRQWKTLGRTEVVNLRAAPRDVDFELDIRLDRLAKGVPDMRHVTFEAYVVPSAYFEARSQAASTPTAADIDLTRCHILGTWEVPAWHSSLHPPSLLASADESLGLFQPMFERMHSTPSSLPTTSPPFIIVTAADISPPAIALGSLSLTFAFQGVAGRSQEASSNPFILVQRRLGGEYEPAWVSPPIRGGGTRAPLAMLPGVLDAITPSHAVTFVMPIAALLEPGSGVAASHGMTLEALKASAFTVRLEIFDWNDAGVDLDLEAFGDVDIALADLLHVDLIGGVKVPFSAQPPPDAGANVEAETAGRLCIISASLQALRVPESPSVLSPVLTMIESDPAPVTSTSSSVAAPFVAAPAAASTPAAAAAAAAAAPPHILVPPPVSDDLAPPPLVQPTTPPLGPALPLLTIKEDMDYDPHTRPTTPRAHSLHSARVLYDPSLLYPTLPVTAHPQDGGDTQLVSTTHVGLDGGVGAEASHRPIRHHGGALSPPGEPPASAFFPLRGLGGVGLMSNFAPAATMETTAAAVRVAQSAAASAAASAAGSSTSVVSTQQRPPPPARTVIPPLPLSALQLPPPPSLVNGSATLAVHRAMQGPTSAPLFSPVQPKNVPSMQQPLPKPHMMHIPEVRLGTSSSCGVPPLPPPVVVMPPSHQHNRHVNTVMLVGAGPPQLKHLPSPFADPPPHDEEPQAPLEHETLALSHDAMVAREEVVDSSGVAPLVGDGEGDGGDAPLVAHDHPPPFSSSGEFSLKQVPPSPSSRLTDGQRGPPPPARRVTLPAAGDLEPARGALMPTMDATSLHVPPVAVLTRPLVSDAVSSSHGAPWGAPDGEPLPSRHIITCDFTDGIGTDRTYTSSSSYGPSLVSALRSDSTFPPRPRSMRVELSEPTPLPPPPPLVHSIIPVAPAVGMVPHFFVSSTNSSGNGGALPPAPPPAPSLSDLPMYVFGGGGWVGGGGGATPPAPLLHLPSDSSSNAALGIRPGTGGLSSPRAYPGIVIASPIHSSTPISTSNSSVSSHVPVSVRNREAGETSHAPPPPRTPAPSTPHAASSRRTTGPPHGAAAAAAPSAREEWEHKPQLQSDDAAFALSSPVSIVLNSYAPDARDGGGGTPLSTRQRPSWLRTRAQEGEGGGGDAEDTPFVLGGSSSKSGEDVATLCANTVTSARLLLEADLIKQRSTEDAASFSRTRAAAAAEPATLARVTPRVTRDGDATAAIAASVSLPSLGASAAARIWKGVTFPVTGLNAWVNLTLAPFEQLQEFASAQRSAVAAAVAAMSHRPDETDAMMLQSAPLATDALVGYVNDVSASGAGPAMHISAPLLALSAVGLGSNASPALLSVSEITCAALRSDVSVLRTALDEARKEEDATNVGGGSATAQGIAALSPAEAQRAKWVIAMGGRGGTLNSVPIEAYRKLAAAAETSQKALSGQTWFRAGFDAVAAPHAATELLAAALVVNNAQAPGGVAEECTRLVRSAEAARADGVHAVAKLVARVFSAKQALSELAELRALLVNERAAHARERVQSNTARDDTVMALADFEGFSVQGGEGVAGQRAHELLALADMSDDVTRGRERRLMIALRACHDEAVASVSVEYEKRLSGLRQLYADTAAGIRVEGGRRVMELASNGVLAWIECGAAGLGTATPLRIRQVQSDELARVLSAADGYMLPPPPVESPMESRERQVGDVPSKGGDVVEVSDPWALPSFKPFGHAQKTLGSPDPARSAAAFAEVAEAAAAAAAAGADGGAGDASSRSLRGLTDIRNAQLRVNARISEVEARIEEARLTGGFAAARAGLPTGAGGRVAAIAAASTKLQALKVSLRRVWAGDQFAFHAAGTDARTFFAAALAAAPFSWELASYLRARTAGLLPGKGGRAPPPPPPPPPPLTGRVHENAPPQASSDWLGEDPRVFSGEAERQGEGGAETTYKTPVWPPPLDAGGWGGGMRDYSRLKL